MYKKKRTINEAGEDSVCKLRIDKVNHLGSSFYEIIVFVIGTRETAKKSSLLSGRATSGG